MESSNVWIDLCYGGSWENINGSLQYMPLGMNLSLQLPVKKLTYKRLKLRVAKKLSLDPASELGLTYFKHGKVYLLNDNEDVDRFMSYCLSGDMSTLYVVDSKSSEIRSGTGSNQYHQQISVTPHFYYPTQYQTHTDHYFSSQPVQYLQPSQNPQLFLENPNPNQFTDPNLGFRIQHLDDDEPKNKSVSTSHFGDFDFSRYNDLEDDSEWILGESKEEETIHVKEHHVDSFDFSQYDDLEDDSDWILGQSKEEEIVHDDNEEDIGVKEPTDHPFFNSYDLEEEEEEEEEVPKENKKKVILKEPREYYWKT